MYERSLSAARGLAQMKQSIEALKQLGESPDLVEYFGYITDWKVIGPFDNSEGAGFEKVYPPEEQLDFAQQYQGKSAPVKWIDHSTGNQDQDIEQVGLVDLNKVLAEEKGVVAYLTATFYSAHDRELECRYGTVNATKLWVNGELLLSKNIYHMGGEFDQYIAPVKLRQGANTILLKICQNEQTETWTRSWNFRFRVTDELGGGVNQDPLPQ